MSETAKQVLTGIGVSIFGIASAPLTGDGTALFFFLPAGIYLSVSALRKGVLHG